MKSTFCGKTKNGTVTAIVATLALTSLLIGAAAAQTESIIDDVTPTVAATLTLSEMRLAWENSNCLAQRGDSGGLSYMNLDLTNTVTPTPAHSFIWLPLVVKNYHTDTYEPNNSPDDAYALVSGTTYYSYIWCPNDDANDDDWYYIISTLNTITIHLYVPSVADYDLYLYDSTMTLVASSSSYGNGIDEHIEYKPDQAGKYYIRVYPYEGCCSNTYAYSLVGTFTAPPTPTPTLTSTPTPTLIHTLTHTPTPTSTPTPTHTPTPTLTPTHTPTPTSTPTPLTSFPISVAPYEQSAPAMAYNSKKDEYIVVWQDARLTPTTVFDIYGQRVSSTGNLLDNPISPQDERTPAVNFAIFTGQDQQQCSAVAYSTNTNQYLVIWQDSRPGTVTPVSTHSCIYGQVISGTGELIDPTGTPGPSDPSVNFPIAEKEEAQCYPGVSYSSNACGEYLVVWQEDISDTASRIYGQRLWGSRPWVPRGPAFPISTYTSNNQESPAVAYNSCRDEYLVVWQDEDGTLAETGWDIYGQRISGHYQGSPYKDDSFAICSVGDDQVSPSVAYNDAAREYLVVWQDARNNPNYSIYGQGVPETGGHLDSNFPISATTDCNRNPSVAYNSSANEYLVVWQGYATESTEWAVYGQWISGEGELKGENSRISIESNDPPLSDVGYSNSANSYLVVWSHEGNIYGQLVGSGPTPTMTPTPTPPYVEFNKECYYTTSETATITVVDPNCNRKPEEREIIDVEVKSDSCPLGICICLTETSDNSGRFTSTTALQFSTDLCEDSSNTIQVTDGDKIIAKHHANSYIKTDEAFWYEVAPTPTPTCIAIWMSTVETPRPTNPTFPTPAVTPTSTSIHIQMTTPSVTNTAIPTPTATPSATPSWGG